MRVNFTSFSPKAHSATSVARASVALPDRVHELEQPGSGSFTAVLLCNQAVSSATSRAAPNSSNLLVRLQCSMSFCLRIANTVHISPSNPALAHSVSTCTWCFDGMPCLALPHLNGQVRKHVVPDLCGTRLTLCMRKCMLQTYNSATLTADVCGASVPSTARIYNQGTTLPPLLPLPLPNE